MKMALYALRLTQNEGALNLINIVKTFWKLLNKGFTEVQSITMASTVYLFRLNKIPLTHTHATFFCFAK